MTIFATQHIRDKADISWGEEYVLGLVEMTEPINTTRIQALVLKQGAMVYSTAQYHIEQAIAKSFIRKHKDKEDGRIVYHSLTEKGKKLMEKLRDAEQR